MFQIGASLSSAHLLRLREANLSRAILRGTNMAHAKITEEQLEKAKSLEGATMPNGQKYGE